jgi:glc operon protein GlcG
MTMRFSALLFAVFLSLGLPYAATAQAPQQAPGITYEMVKKAMDAAEAEARANGWNVTIVITDAAGVPLYLRRLDGANPRSYDIALNKARTSASTGLTTIEYGQQVSAGTLQAVQNGITFEGGLPIRLNGQLVGGIGTSGVRANQDAEISRAGLAAIGAT